MSDDQKPIFRILTYADMCREIDEERAFQSTLEPSDPRHNKMFRYDDDLGYLDLYRGGYEYSYEMSLIETQQGFLAFLEHVLAKEWEYATGARVGRLIRAHAKKMHWHLHGPIRKPIFEPESRHTSDTDERAKLTPKLRYDVLRRDNFRCRACGFGVEDGAHLHIDHIIPISKFGQTIFENLQALCSTCNLGKGARR